MDKKQLVPGCKVVLLEPGSLQILEYTGYCEADLLFRDRAGYVTVLQAEQLKMYRLLSTTECRCGRCRECCE